MEPNYYEILGVSETAEHDELQEAYRRLAKANHPDCSGADSTGLFLKIQDAWDVLGDEERRREYDRRMRRERGPARQNAFRSKCRTPGHPVVGWLNDFFLAETGSDLELELRMTAAEAAGGGSISTEVPAVARCRSCFGMAGDFTLFCTACGGRGYRLQARTLNLDIPGRLVHGDVLELPLGGDFLHRRLVLHVVITR